MKKNIIVSVLLLGLLGACVTPTYQQVASGQADLNAQDVNFKISGLFYRDPPDCVTVMAAKSDKNHQLGEQIAMSLARYLGEKVDRVIFPRKRKMIEQKKGYDLANPADRRRYALSENCRYYAVAELYDFGDDYAGVFAKKQIGIKLDLARLVDDEPLWQAAHTVWRADGSVPLSPFSAVGGLASAALFNADPEVVPSLIDDAMRRMMRTLPPV